MSFRRAILFLVVVLAISTEAAFPARSLLQSICGQACNAAFFPNSTAIQALINSGHDLCDCRCTDDGQTPMHVAVRFRCHKCIEVHRFSASVSKTLIL